MTNFLTVVMQLVAQSCPTLCDCMDCSPPGSSVHRLSGKNTGVGSHSLPQGIFLTQGLNLGLLHCRQILYLQLELLRILVYLTAFQILAICVTSGRQRPSSQTQKKISEKSRQNIYISKTQGQKCKFLHSIFFFPFKVRLLKTCSIKPAFFQLCIQKHNLGMSKELQFGHFYSEVSFNLQQSKYL